MSYELFNKNECLKNSGLSIEDNDILLCQDYLRDVSSCESETIKIFRVIENNNDSTYKCIEYKLLRTNKNDKLEHIFLTSEKVVPDSILLDCKKINQEKLDIALSTIKEIINRQNGD